MENRIINEIEGLNPWLQDTSVPIFNSANYLDRQQANKLSEPEWDNLVTVLVGPRQSGKTTLGKFLCQEKLKNTNKYTQLIYLNCDSPIIREWLSGIYIINELKETFSLDAFILFIDEIQRLENPGLLVKAIHDLGLPVKLIITGSSQLEISSKIKEHLTGRKIEALILPLSYTELPNPKRLEKRAIYGCYPQVVTRPSFQILLSELYRNYINRDIIEFLKIAKPTVFEKLMTLVAHSSGQLLNYQSMATDCNVSAQTLKSYLQVLEKTYIIKTIQPFTGNKRSEVTSNPKCYYIDNGFRNQALGNFSALESRSDKGLLIESVVFQELYKYKAQHFLDYHLHFWRTKSGAEVDFVIKKNDRCILPVEVKYQTFKQPKISRSLRSFINAYTPNKTVIVTNQFESSITIESTEVLFIPFQKLGKLFTLINEMDTVIT